MHHHRRPGTDRVMPRNGIYDHSMRHDGFIDQLLVCNVHEHHNRRIDNGNQLLHHHVLAALCNTGMESNVVLNIALSGMNLVFHPSAEPLQAFDVFLRCILRRHLRNSGFQKKSYIDKIQCKRIFILNGPKSQGIRQSLRCRDNIRPGAAPDLHNSLAGKELYGFTNGTSPHAKPLSQFKLIRKLCPRLHRSIQNVMIDLVLHLLCQQLILQVRKITHRLISIRLPLSVIRHRSFVFPRILSKPPL